MMPKPHLLSPYPFAPVASRSEGPEPGAFAVPTPQREIMVALRIEMTSVTVHGQRARGFAPGDVRATLDATLKGFRRTRDFLGLQLNHAWGNLEEVEFEQLALPFLDQKERGSLSDAERHLEVLAAVGAESLDASTIAELFNVTVKDAIRLAERFGARAEAART